MAGRATFVATSRERLLSAPFLDGRSPFSSGEEETIPLAALAEPGSDTTEAQLRLIMHMSFCGSTQLAQLIDATGAAQALKEPQALVDLADWQRAMVEQRVADARFEPVLKASLGLLSRQWDNSVPTVLKASNWANNLLPEILEGTSAQVLLVRIDRRPFVRAVFRGGRDRMAFTARAAAHLAAATGQSPLVQSAIASAADPLDQIARLALVIHAIQETLFTEALNRGPGRCGQVDYATLATDPEKALREASAILQLDPSADDIASAIEQRSSLDSKAPGHGFLLSEQDQEDQAVELQHGQCFDRALAWAEANLPS